jgi:uncharacterized RDD family membrane protein YckC
VNITQAFSRNPTRLRAAFPHGGPYLSLAAGRIRAAAALGGPGPPRSLSPRRFFMDPQAPETRSNPGASYAPPSGQVAPVVAARPDIVKRGIAAVIDFVGIGIVNGVLGFALGIPLGWVGSMAAAAVALALVLGRDVLLEGRSPGKKLLGLAVVRADGGPITVQESIRRNSTLAIGSAVGVVAAIPILGLLAIPLYLVAMAVSLYELYLVATNQPRLGDKLAGGTQVVFQGQAAIAF